MFVTIQQREIPVDLQLGAIAHICKVFGIEIDLRCSLEVIKNQFRQRVDKFKKITCISGPGTAVYIRNLPLSFHQFHVMTLMNLLSDFNLLHKNFYVDMYQDSQNRNTGKCLIRFMNAKFVSKVFEDLQALTALDSNIIVTLDIGDELSKKKDIQDPFYKPGTKKNKRLRRYINQQKLDFSDCSMTDTMNGQVKSSNVPALTVLANSDECGGNGKSTPTDKASKPGFDTKKHDDSISQNIKQGPTTIKIQQKGIPEKFLLGAVAYVCKEFGIKMKQGSSLSDMQKLFRQRAVGLKTILSQKIHPDLFTSSTKAVHITNLPLSFHKFHITALMFLLSDFDLSYVNFYIDMFQDAQNRNTGECLIRFFTRKFVQQVFIDMLGLRAFNRKITVKLDIDCVLCSAKDLINPFCNSKKKVNKSLRQFIMHENFDFSNCVLTKTGEDDDDVIEVINKHDTIEINDSDDDTVEVKDEYNVGTKRKDNGKHDIVEIKNSDRDTECGEKRKSVSIDEASIQDLKAVTKIEPLDMITLNSSRIKQGQIDNIELIASKARQASVKSDKHFNEDKTGGIITSNAGDKSDILFYEDKTGDIVSNNDGEGQSDLLFYEDKTGDIITSNSGEISGESDIHKAGDINTSNAGEVSGDTDVRYKVQVGAIDDRTIVSVATFGNNKENTRIRTLKVLIERIQKKLQYDLHTVAGDGECTMKFLLKFSTAEKAELVYRGLIGAKIKKKPIKVNLLSSKELSFPKANKNETNSVSQVLSVAKRKLISETDARAAKGQLAKRKKIDKTHTRPGSDVVSLAYIPLEECGDDDTYGLDLEFLQKHNINLPLGTTVVVKNLHSAMDKENLIEVFSRAGKIRNIIPNTEGRSAKIEFDHPVEAVQAISLFHNKDLHDQKITVEMDNVPLPSGLFSVGRGLGEGGAPLKGVRNVIDLVEAKKALVEAGKLIKLRATDRTMPFKYTYIEQEQSKIDDNGNNSVKDLNISNVEASDIDFKNSEEQNEKDSDISNAEARDINFKTSDEQNEKDLSVSNAEASDINFKTSEKQNEKDSDIFDSTSIRELNIALASQGLIPKDTNCKDLESILNVLKTNPTKNQPKNEDNIQRNHTDIVEQAPPKPELNKNLKDPNLVRNRPYSVNRPPNSNMANFIPNQSTQLVKQAPPKPELKKERNLVRNKPYPVNKPPNSNMANFIPNQSTQAMNQMVCRFSNLPRPNMAPHIRFHPNMNASGRNTNMPNMAFNMPHMVFNMPHINQNAMFRPRVGNAIQRAAMLYADQPHSWNYDPNFRPRILRTLPISQQVWEKPPSKIYNKKEKIANKQRYFSQTQNLPESSFPLRPSYQNSFDTKEQNDDVIYIKTDPPKRQLKTESDERLQTEIYFSKAQGDKKDTDMLIFKNLPQCVSNEALSSKLSEVGELLFCEMTGRGRAVVRFKDAADADRCLKLFNGSKVEGQVIAVSLVQANSTVGFHVREMRILQRILSSSGLTKTCRYL